MSTVPETPVFYERKSVRADEIIAKDIVEIEEGDYVTCLIAEPNYHGSGYTHVETGYKAPFFSFENDQYVTVIRRLIEE